MFEGHPATPLTISLHEVSKYRVISGQYFPVFGLNTGKYGPEITPYLDTFHVVYASFVVVELHYVLALRKF